VQTAVTPSATDFPPFKHKPAPPYQRQPAGTAWVGLTLLYRASRPEAHRCVDKRPHQGMARAIIFVAEDPGHIHTKKDRQHKHAKSGGGGSGPAAVPDAHGIAEGVAQGGVALCKTDQQQRASDAPATVCTRTQAPLKSKSRATW